MMKRDFRVADQARRPRVTRGPGRTGCGTYIFPLVYEMRISADTAIFFQLSYNNGPQTGFRILYSLKSY